MSPVPSSDGQVLTYSPKDGCQGSVAAGAAVIYVNGMLTDGVTHANTAQLIADLTGSTVLGLYNLSGGATHAFVEEMRHAARAVSKASRDAATIAAVEARKLDAAAAAMSNEMRELGSTFDHEALRFERSCRANLTGVHRALYCGSISVARAAVHLQVDQISTVTRDLGHFTATTMTHVSAGVNYVATRVGVAIDGVLGQASHLAAGVEDGAQAVGDWIHLLTALSDEHIVAWLSLPAPVRAMYVAQLLSKNPATRSLFRLLEETIRNYSTVHLIAHSQGNLIASAAVSALVLSNPNRRLPLRVFALASPAIWWPHVPGLLSYRSYDNPADFVAQLDLDRLRRRIPGWSDTMSRPTDAAGGVDDAGEFIVQTGPKGAGAHSVTDTYLAEQSPVVRDLRQFIGSSPTSCKVDRPAVAQ